MEIRQTELFARWFIGLRDPQARRRIQARIDRLEIGNPGDVRPVGGGVSEMRIDYGPGYRVYFVEREIHSSFCSPAATRARRNGISRPRAGSRRHFEAIR